MYRIKQLYAYIYREIQNVLNLVFAFIWANVMYNGRPKKSYSI